MEALNATFADLSAQTGFPADQLKYLACLLAAIPLSYIFRLLGPVRENAKHVLSIVISIFFCHFSLGEYSWIHSFITAMISYTLLSILPHGVAHKAVFVVHPPPDFSNSNILPEPQDFQLPKISFFYL